MQWLAEVYDDPEVERRRRLFNAAVWRRHPIPGCCCFVHYYLNDAPDKFYLEGLFVIPGIRTHPASGTAEILEYLPWPDREYGRRPGGWPENKYFLTTSSHAGLEVTLWQSLNFEVGNSRVSVRPTEEKVLTLIDHVMQDLQECVDTYERCGNEL